MHDVTPPDFTPADDFYASLTFGVNRRQFVR